MSVYLLNEELIFPDPNDAETDGLLAVGGDLSEARLILAYENGIFPWYNPGDPILWWSPNPRGVIIPSAIKVSKSMRNVLNRNDFEVKYDEDFRQVIMACRNARRKERGTWISDDITEAYIKLHEMGLAHSVEIWRNGKLVGGLYGVSLGGAFFGESMFSHEKNTSKIALIHLARRLELHGFKMIDCQLYTSHLGSLGAIRMSRRRFMTELEQALKMETIIGNWSESWSKDGYEAK